MARFLPRHKLEQAADWFAERGLAVVFLSRFTPGLRLPAYVAAGILRARVLVVSPDTFYRRRGVDTAAGRRHRAFG
jgi:hypothetical protein